MRLTFSRSNWLLFQKDTTDFYRLNLFIKVEISVTQMLLVDMNMIIMITRLNAAGFQTFKQFSDSKVLRVMTWSPLFPCTSLT